MAAAHLPAPVHSSGALVPRWWYSGRFRWWRDAGKYPPPEPALAPDSFRRSLTSSRCQREADESSAGRGAIAWRTVVMLNHLALRPAVSSSSRIYQR